MERLENEVQVLAHSAVTQCAVPRSGRILWTALNFTMAATVICYLEQIRKDSPSYLHQQALAELTFSQLLKVVFCETHYRVHSSLS